MTLSHMHSKVRLCFIASALGLFCSPVAAVPVLQPEDSYSQTVRIVARLLSVQHYSRKVLDDALSELIWQRYIDSLDEQRIYFTEQDITGFEPWRQALDDQFKSGNLAPTFAIYNLCLKRQGEYLTFALDELGRRKRPAAPANFKMDNGPTTARPRDQAELNLAWQKHLQTVLEELKQAAPGNEQPEEILKRRYRSQLARLDRARPKDAFQAVMDAFTETYDPHTNYYPAPASAPLEKIVQREGVGLVLQGDEDYPRILRVMPSSPAQRSQQLAPGDRIMALADGGGDFVAGDADLVDIAGWHIDEVVERMRGPKGSRLRLRVMPAAGGAIREIQLVRDAVEVEAQAASKSVLTSTREGKTRRVGVIRLPYFYSDFQAIQAGDPNYLSVTRDVCRLIEELKKENVDGVMIDLRDNSGGSVAEISSLIGELIAAGPTMQIRDGRGRVDALGDDNPAMAYQGPLAVVINRVTASGAEIFVAGLQDYGRALVIGSPSYGNGTIQSMRGFGSGTLKITEAKFYRISGASTQVRGVQPDVLLPDPYDPQKIGESVYDSYLPWDTVPPAIYQRLNRVKASLPQLAAASRKRLQVAGPRLTADVLLAEAVEVFVDSLGQLK